LLGTRHSTGTVTTSSLLLEMHTATEQDILCVTVKEGAGRVGDMWGKLTEGKRCVERVGIV
jgi:hypothetical protein